MLPLFKLYVTFYSDLLHLPANYTIETVYFVQLAVFCKAGTLQFWVAFKSFAFTQQLTKIKIARNSISLWCAHVNTSIVCRLNRYEFFCLQAKLSLM